MNGIPKLDALRSISLYGLSSVTMNFDVRHRSVLRAGAGVRADPERRGARRRHARDVAAVQPERPDLPLRAPEPGPLGAGAEDPRGLGARAAATARSRASPTTPASAATTMQYQVQLDPNQLFVVRRHACRRSSQQLASNNANAGGGFYSQGGQFYYVRGLGQVEILEDIGNIVVADARRHSGLREGRRRRWRSATRRGSASSATCARTTRSKASS